MTGRAPRVEVRLLLDPADYRDLKSISKVSGLLPAQFVRSLLLNFLARTYSNTETNAND